MIITGKRNTHFTNLIGEENFANAYFFKETTDGYNVEKLHELEKKCDSAMKKYKFGLQLLSVSGFVGTESLIKKSALKLEKDHKKLLTAKNKLEIFESNLAYLILSGKIAFPDELGFSCEYIKELLKRKKEELINSTVIYYYDESIGKTYEIYNDKYIALSHTPYVVNNKVSQNRQYRL